jgi:hypothetical protein
LNNNVALGCRLYKDGLSTAYIITWDTDVVAYFKILIIPTLERLNRSKNIPWE